ncbi:hypothetical protein [Pseudomonas sp. P7548]|uniref:hypothetical protein n=1 Tax=Pseudomonas sp. P7548 TaxID=2726981 RepID=UPI0015BD88CF|nr:hypothetical protein [Pseudomonas sp. P7548]NWE18065.1 hypothetical protein [Pseudomonas sp. P7548]
MSADDQVERLLMQLVRDTSMGAIRWSLTEPHYFLTNATEDKVVSFYGAIYNQLEVGVYESRYKYWHDEESFHWSSEIRFSVVKDGTLVLDYRKSSAPLFQLFQMAKAQTLNIESLLKDSLF